MIRRKIWATATFCMAIAGASQAQSGSTPKASLGLPKSEAPAYLARGVAPNAGYPTYVPRNYVSPTPPGYSAPANLGQASSGAVSSPVELFAIDAVVPPAVGPSPMAVPAPMPMTAGPATMGPPPTLVNPGMPMPGMEMQSPMPGSYINGGPMVGGAPYLDGMNDYVDGAVPNVWLSGEYMMWKFKGLTVPPLSSTAPAGSPGTVTDALTHITYGDKNILQAWENGYRVRGGFWFPDGAAGLDLGFFTTGNLEEKTLLSSDGGQGIFRPFFNSAISAEDAQLIAFTDPIAGPLFAGILGTRAETMLTGFEANYRTGFGMGFGGRLDALVGYRFMNLRDRLQIQSRATTLTALGTVPAGTQILVDDHFESTNTFHGGQVGFVGEWMIGAMTFGMRGTVGVGVTKQYVDIAGLSTSLTPGGSAVTSAGGLLAQPTNMGSFDRSRISVLPEIGVTLGYQCTNNIRVFGGVNALCWTNVARAGEQINRNVNASVIADPTTGVRTPFGAPAPTFHFRDEHFYAYGYSFGLECRW